MCVEHQFVKMIQEQTFPSVHIYIYIIYHTVDSCISGVNEAVLWPDSVCVCGCVELCSNASTAIIFVILFYSQHDHQWSDTCHCPDYPHTPRDIHLLLHTEARR